MLLGSMVISKIGNGEDNLEKKWLISERKQLIFETFNCLPC